MADQRQAADKRLGAVVIEVGSPIPLAIKLFDENPSAKVQATLYTLDGERLESVAMFHVEKGLYLNTMVPMPDQKVVAVYEVTNSEEYAQSAELFLPKPKVQPEESFLQGIVIERSKDQTFIQGVIYEVAN